MYRLAGRGGFYVAVAVDDLRFLRVTHSLPLHDRNVWKKKKKRKKKQRAALRAVKKLFTATYIIWYERDRKCRAFTESSRIYIPSFRPRNVKWFVMKSSVTINPAPVKNFTFSFFHAYVNSIRNWNLERKESRNRYVARINNNNNSNNNVEERKRDEIEIDLFGSHSNKTRSIELRWLEFLFPRFGARSFSILFTRKRIQLDGMPVLYN